MLFNTGTNLKDTTAKIMLANPNRQISPIPETDGSTVELAKRPRGRPPGSKNKPKLPILLTCQPEPAAASSSSSTAFRPHVLEIPAGQDVLDALRGFSRRKRLGLCVLSCSGAVADVTLRQPPHPTSPAPPRQAGTVGLRGRMEVLSLSATVMPPPATAAEVAGVAVTVAGPGGQVVGGAVVGPLVAAGTVTVVAAAFEKPTFHRLPVAAEEDEVEKSENKVLVMAQQQQQEPQRQQQHYAQREYPQHHQVVAESCGMGIYSTSFGTDVVWAPVARPPHRGPY